MFSTSRLALATALLTSVIAAPAPPNPSYYQGIVYVTPVGGDSTSGGCLSSMHYVPPAQSCPLQQIRLVDDAAPEKGFRLFEGVEVDTPKHGPACSPGTFSTDGYAYCGKNVTDLPELMETFHFVEASEKGEGKVPKSAKIAAFGQNATWFASGDASVGGDVRKAKLSTRPHGAKDIPVTLSWTNIG